MVKDSGDVISSSHKIGDANRLKLARTRGPPRVAQRAQSLELSENQVSKTKCPVASGTGARLSESQWDARRAVREIKVALLNDLERKTRKGGMIITHKSRQTA